ncbi:MAG: chemotaxis protein CheA [Defluviitaleaceae bacterium]|nr:chemotaxis protein CheA [Defluviitaleaceae bacterium]
MGDYDKSAMLETFIYEMRTLLEQLENISVQADAGLTSDMINEIFRIMHTIKGSAAMMMYNGIATTAHAIEDLFYYLREQNPEIDNYEDITDLTLEVTDFIKGELEVLESGTDPDGEAVDLIARIKEYVAKLKGETVAAGGDATTAKPKTTSGKPSINGKKYHAFVLFEEGCEMENVRAYGIIHNLESVASDIVSDPEDLMNEDTIETIRNEGLHISFNTELNFDKIQEIFMRSVFVRDLRLEVIEEVTAASSGLNNFEVHIKFQEGCEMENVRAYGVVHNLTGLCESIIHTPSNLVDESSIESVRADGLKMLLVTDKSIEEIKKLLDATICLESLEINEATSLAADTAEEASPVSTDQVQEGAEQVALKEPGISSSDEPENKQPAAAQAAGHKKPTTQSTISVNVGKLDQLMNLVGELVISESMVTQNPDLTGLELENFTKEARQLHKIIKDVQDTVMSMRMVSLSPTFFKMNRIVRDMCKTLGKEVNLEVVGADTEVDKNIIEHISDPLMHIIRNSVDHGIEIPENRIKKGKPEKGKITLEAKNQGGDVLIIVKDDGQGLNRDKIMEKAKRQGLLTKPEEEYSEKEIYGFILLPGFSTNENVTQFSGRGVGMDVVTSNIEVVGGTVIVDSTPGEGSIFTLKIPLTLAIIEGMIIKVGDTKYTIPIISIEKSFKATENDLVIDPSGNEMITVREETFNFVRLNKEFAWNEGVCNVEEGIVMMLENGEHKICVLVDELIGEQPVVVKSIPKYIKKPPGISGCTLLGNGEISLIIDVAGFFDR